MREQTDKLCASLPCLAPIFAEADIVGSHNWYIVRFDVSPTEVQPEQFRVLKLQGQKNEFSSRTAALRASEVLLRPVKEQRSEKGHWGVWCVNNGKKVFWQSVLPLRRIVAEKAEEGKEQSQPAPSKAPSEPVQMAKRLEPLQIAPPASQPPTEALEQVRKENEEFQAKKEAERNSPEAQAAQKSRRAERIAAEAKRKREEMARKAEEATSK